MGNKVGLRVIVLVVIGWFLGLITIFALNVASTKEEDANESLTVHVENSEEVELTNELVWIDEICVVNEKYNESGDDERFSITVKLPTVNQIIILEISKIEYKILQKDDLVTVHYIYTSDSNEIVYSNFVRDEKGRINISEERPIVVVDPGHGGVDNGEGTNEWWVEKELNLDISFKMKEVLEEAGIKVIMTRESDEYISLFDRCVISNYVEADLFISNHLNRFDEETKGIEVIYSSIANPEFANNVAEAVVSFGQEIFRVHNRRSDRYTFSDYYFVHKYNDVPSYIIEYGFSDNIEDSEIIINNWGEIVEAVGKEIIIEVQN